MEGSASTGAARKRRLQRVRADCHHVAWLHRLYQHGASHHSHHSVSSIESRLASLEQFVNVIVGLLPAKPQSPPAAVASGWSCPLCGIWKPLPTTTRWDNVRAKPSEVARPAQHDSTSVSPNPVVLPEVALTTAPSACEAASLMGDARGGEAGIPIPMVSAVSVNLAPTVATSPQHQSIGSLVAPSGSGSVITSSSSSAALDVDASSPSRPTTIVPEPVVCPAIAEVLRENYRCTTSFMEDFCTSAVAHYRASGVSPKQSDITLLLVRSGVHFEDVADIGTDIHDKILKCL